MPNWRILIVDDEDDIRSIVRAALSTKYEVVEAHDGLDALEKLELAEPDFVVLDVMMPLMDGFQTCEAIRRNPRFCNLSVLFLSALNSKEDMKRGYGAGANLYLTKPFDPSRLLRNVDLFFEENPPPVRRKRYTLEELKQIEAQGARTIAEAKSAPLPPPEEPGPAQAFQVPETPEHPPKKTDAQGPWYAGLGITRAAKQAEPAEAAHSSAPPPPAPVATAPPRPRVMVVDDDQDIIAFAKAILGEDYEVVSAADGLEGIERITVTEPDMIVLDALMPKMSGYQLCQSLRRNRRHSQTPILFISAKATPRDREYALRIGGNEFLPKPFTSDELRARIDVLAKLPTFHLYPKTLPYERVEQDESLRKKALEEKKDRLSRKQETELEKFLREHKDE